MVNIDLLTSCKCGQEVISDQSDVSVDIYHFKEEKWGQFINIVSTPCKYHVNTLPLRKPTPPVHWYVMVLFNPTDK